MLPEVPRNLTCFTFFYLLCYFVTVVTLNKSLSSHILKLVQHHKQKVWCYILQTFFIFSYHSQKHLTGGIIFEFLTKYTFIESF